MNFRQVYSAPVSVEEHHKIRASYANFYGYLENFEIPSPHRIIADHIWVNDLGMKPFSLETRKFVIYTLRKNKRAKVENIIPFGFYLNGNLKSNNLLVGQIEKCPYGYILDIIAKKRKFLFFIQERPIRGEVLHRFPSNWQEGIVFNELIKIKVGNQVEFEAVFQKRYIRNLGKTMNILSNLNESELVITEEITENFPFEL